ncbi:MAG TPA: hypothetical protein VF245_07205 [Solirubrobacterales bacterium]
MLRTDTGNFNRFLTSLGLLLLAAALLIPYFYFHDTEVLRITQRELQGLTQTGHDAILARQRRAADLEVWILGLSAALVLGGITCLWFGGKRLRYAQTKEDEAIDRQAKRDDVEIQRLSDVEVEKKRDEQAREATAAERAGDVTSGAPVEPQVQTDRGEAERRPTPVASVAENRAAIVRIEEAVREAFEKSEVDSYEFISEARLVSGKERLLVDGLFRATEDNLDVLLELKIVRQVRSLSFRGRQSADSALASLARYKAITGRRATTLLVIVVPRGVDEFPLEDRRQLEDRISAWLAGEGVVAIVPEEEIPTLPARLSQAIGRWRPSPGQA